MGLGREVRERLDGGRVTDDPAFLHHHARRTAADGVVKFRPAVAAVDATAQYVMGPQIPWKATWVGDSCGGLEASASASVCVRLRGRSKNRRHRALQRVERLNASASTWIARVGLSFRRPALGMSQHRPRRSAEHLGIGSQHPGCGRLRADRGVSGRVWARRRRRCCYVVPRDLRGGGATGHGEFPPQQDVAESRGAQSDTISVGDRSGRGNGHRLQPVGSAVATYHHMPVYSIMIHAGPLSTCDVWQWPCASVRWVRPRPQRSRNRPASAGRRARELERV